jgi:hypothetical protein
MQPRGLTGCSTIYGALAFATLSARVSRKRWPCFETYNIVDERDLHDAADKLGKYLNGKNGKDQK